MEYTNACETDLPAPILTILADTALLRPYGPTLGEQAAEVLDIPPRAADNGTALTLRRILQVADQDFTPKTGVFFGGNKTMTSALNTVLSGINEDGDIP